MVQIPDELIARPWRMSAKAGLDGLPTPSELRSGLWRRPHRGVLAWAGSDADDPMQRILAAATAVDCAPLGGWAAAYLHGAKELDGESPEGEALPVLFCIGKSGTKRRRDGLQPFRSPMGIDDVVRIDGVLCTSLVRTTFDLVRLAPTLADAVADVDTMLRCTRLRLADVERYVQQQRRVPGLVQAREALRLADPLSLSRPESKLRVLWVVDARVASTSSQRVGVRPPHRPTSGRPRPPGCEERTGGGVRRRLPLGARAEHGRQPASGTARGTRADDRPRHGARHAEPGATGRPSANGLRPCPPREKAGLVHPQERSTRALTWVGSLTASRSPRVLCDLRSATRRRVAPGTSHRSGRRAGVPGRGGGRGCQGGEVARAVAQAGGAGPGRGGGGRSGCQGCHGRVGGRRRRPWASGLCDVRAATRRRVQA